MSEKPKRRTVFISKRFQAGFSVKFLLLIAAESILAIALFMYMSSGTFTTGYSGTGIIVARTGEYFLPTVLLANLVVIGATAAAGFAIMLYTSHKIAGPLYRFEKSLEEIGNGDLTHRFTLRSHDQLGELAGKLNEFNSNLDGAVGSIQQSAAELETTLSEVLKTLDDSAGGPEGKNEEIKERLKRTKLTVESLKRSVSYFKTSKGSNAL